MSGFGMRLGLRTLFRREPAPLLGIDIGTSSVRLVELARAGKRGLRLECCACENLPHGAVSDGNIEQSELVSQALRRVWKNSGARTRNVALCMPAASVISKKILLPAGLLEAELEAYIDAEAGQYLPFALDDMSLDFDVMEGSPDTAGDIEVMLAATRRDKVEQRVMLAAAAGLTVLVMEVESHAAHAALSHVLRSQQTAQQAASGYKIVALCQIGTGLMHFSVLQDGRAIHESESAFGGKLLTQEIVRTHQMTQQEAELRKKSADLPQDYQQDILQPFLDGAVWEVCRASELFAASFEKKFSRNPPTLAALYLAGGCVLIPGLAQLLSERCNIPCALAWPFEGMHLAPDLDSPSGALRSEAAAYLVACGLALRRFG